MLAVWFYGTLPLVLFYLLTIILIYAGMSSEQFDINNAIGTNIGYYLAGGESPHWLVALLASVDIFAIWSALLLDAGSFDCGGDQAELCGDRCLRMVVLVFC